jgi:hypothetical protein
MECRRVHEERPRTSTSGGQCGGGPLWDRVVEGSLVIDLVWEVKSEKEVQERQLGGIRFLSRSLRRRGRSLRFAIFA